MFELCIIRLIGRVNCVAIDSEGFEFGICSAVILFLNCNSLVVVRSVWILSEVIAFQNFPEFLKDWRFKLDNLLKWLPNS